MEIRAFVVGCLLLASTLIARAEPLDVPFSTGLNQVNVVNLFTNGPNTFTGSTITSHPGWAVHIAPGGQFTQLRSLSGTPVLNLQWLQDFAGGLDTAVDFQFLVWNGTTATDFAFGSVIVTAAGGFAVNPGGYGSAGGAASFVAPVPEPSTVLIGAMGLGVLAWRRRMRAAPAAA